MQSSRGVLKAGLSCIVVVVVTGCAEEAPPFQEGQGQDANEGAVYPAGPYGIEKGATIANYQFIGFPNPTVDKGELREVQLADFYNPTGTDSFPTDSLYGARPKPIVVLLTVSASWCAPCQYEAEFVLPGLHEKYAPMGAEFLFNLADGPTPGKPAEVKHLVSWTTKYDTAWPSWVDPSYKLGALFESDAFPANIIIDTRTMEIVEIIAGVPEADGPFFDTFEEVLAR